MKLKVELEIPKSRISDLIISAVEGGCNYWANIRIYDKDGTPYFGLGPFADGPDGIFGQVILTFEDVEGEESDFTLDLINPAVAPNQPINPSYDMIVDALEIMSRKYPRYFSDFMGENDDAETADVFIQCCAFGEVKFG